MSHQGKFLNWHTTIPYPGSVFTLNVGIQWFRCFPFWLWSCLPLSLIEVPLLSSVFKGGICIPKWSAVSPWAWGGWGGAACDCGTRIFRSTEKHVGCSWKCVFAFRRVVGARLRRFAHPVRRVSRLGGMAVTGAGSAPPSHLSSAVLAGAPCTQAVTWPSSDLQGSFLKMTHWISSFLYSEIALYYPLVMHFILFKAEISSVFYIWATAGKSGLLFTKSLLCSIG